MPSLETIDIHTSRLDRLWVAGFTLVYGGGLALVAGLVATVARGVLVVPLVMLIFGGTLGYRLWRLGVVAQSDHIVSADR